MLHEIQMLRPVIVKQLGKSAWAYMSDGNPRIVHGYVTFWLYGHECVWGINTNPPLLMQVETDQEFSSFADLLNHLYDPIPF